MIWSADRIILPILDDALRELADEAVQRHVWLGHSKTEVSSMSETTAALFDDSGLDPLLDEKQVVFSPEIDNELRQLRKKLRRCLTAEEEVGTEAVLDSPQWKEIQSMASRILSAISKRH
jgi:hypothetical protein